ncbi:MAG TPA: beta-phosphoglucomutase family hydrolase [Burkholderiaceae bacterium]
MAAAFLFDMDGTIVDNMGYHSASWVRFFANRGRAIDEAAFFAATAGRQNQEIMREYIGAHLLDDEVHALGREKEAVYRELYQPHRRTVAGFDDLIAGAKAQGIKLGVATAAPPENITFILDGLELRTHFDAIAWASEAGRGKPHPDVFLLAAERCGVPPADCIVFEDAPLGVEAARRAGMRAVVLTTTMAADQFAEFDNVIAIVTDFTELSLPALLAQLPASI